VGFALFVARADRTDFFPTADFRAVVFDDFFFAVGFRALSFAGLLFAADFRFVVPGFFFAADFLGFFAGGFDFAEALRPAFFFVSLSFFFAMFLRFFWVATAGGVIPI
jgi:hypothetical protein